MGVNLYSLFGLIARLLTAIIICTYVLPKQFKEVRRPKNEFTGLRWLIFAAIVFYVLTTIPAMAYQFTRLAEGYQTLTLQNFATIVGNLANLLVGLVLVLIYNYKDKGGEE